MTKYDESKLPLWAQHRLEEARQTANYALEELHQTRAAHAVLLYRKWFTIAAPRLEEWSTLWYFAENQPVALCDLGPRDTLLVGRAIDKEQP